MTKQEITERVNAFMIGNLDIDPSWLTPDTELKRDIGISSVDTIAIASFVRSTFHCPIVMAEVKAIITLQDLYDYIEKNMNADN